MTKPTRGHRRFSAEFKAAAVARAQEAVAQGLPQSGVAHALDLNPGLLHQWVVEAVGHGPVPPEETLAEEVQRLRRENELLRLERDFAKKAAAYFAKELP